jgi:hypothetical protein
MIKEKIENELEKLGNKKRLSQKQLTEMTQYVEHEEFTQTLKLGDNIECRIRLQETVSPGKKNELGIDVRKFLNKYPMKGGRQGILISAEKWLPFFKKQILFTSNVAQPEDWIELVAWINKITMEKFPEAYQQELPPPSAPQPQKRQALQPPSRTIKERLQESKLDETNWVAITKKK